MQRKDRTFLHGEEARGEERQGRPKEKQMSQRDKSWGLWKMALSPLAVGAELAACPCCSGRIAVKDGDDEKDAAAGSSSEREKMDGGDSPQR